MFSHWRALVVSLWLGGGGGGGESPGSDVVLMSCQAVHERLHQVVSGEVEDEAERDGDGQSRESFLKDGQQQECQAQTLQRETCGEIRDGRSNHTRSPRRVCACV